MGLPEITYAVGRGSDSQDAMYINGFLVEQRPVMHVYDVLLALSEHGIIDLTVKSTTIKEEDDYPDVVDDLEGDEIDVEDLQYE